MFSRLRIPGKGIRGTEYEWTKEPIPDKVWNQTKIEYQPIYIDDGNRPSVNISHFFTPLIDQRQQPDFRPLQYTENDSHGRMYNITNHPTYYYHY
jgi:hypothetical protein